MGIILPIILVFVIAGTLVMNEIHTALLGAATFELESSAEIVASEVDLFFSQYIEIARQMAYNIQSRDLFMELRPGNRAADMPSFAKTVETYDNILANDDNIRLVWNAAFDSGESARSGGAVKGLPDYDITTRDWYGEMIANKALTITEPYIDSSYGDMVTSVMMPVWNGSYLLGLVGIDITIDNLASIMIEYKLGQTGYVILVSKDGLVVYHPDSDLIGMSIAGSGLGDDIVKAMAKSTFGEYMFTEDNVVKRAVLQPVLGTGWMVLAVIPEHELLASYYHSKNAMYTVFGIGLAILIMICLLIAVAIVRPIRSLSRTAKHIADGDLDVSAAVQTVDETGKLAQSISSMTSRLKDYVLYITEINGVLHKISEGDLTFQLKQKYQGEFSTIKESLLILQIKLSETMSTISTSTVQVSSGAKQIADGAQSLAQGATQQAATIQQVSSSISEIAQKTKDNKEMASRAAALANTIKGKAEKGSQQMDEMLDAVKEIDQAGQDINKVIKVIDDIAFQTNILALNAAVEAARAGVHGKGFAVVADEVRNLASKSAEAAKDTGSLIANSIEKAELGSRIAVETSDSLSEIVAGINESAQIINDIAKSSEEQSIGISQINSEIDQVANVVQQNSAIAQESAAASEEMSGQSSMLEELISQFKL